MTGRGGCHTRRSGREMPARALDLTTDTTHFDDYGDRAAGGDHAADRACATDLEPAQRAPREEIDPAPERGPVHQPDCLVLSDRGHTDRRVPAGGLGTEGSGLSGVQPQRPTEIRGAIDRRIERLHIAELVQEDPDRRYRSQQSDRKQRARIRSGADDHHRRGRDRGHEAEQLEANVGESADLPSRLLVIETEPLISIHLFSIALTASSIKPPGRSQPAPRALTRPRPRGHVERRLGDEADRARGAAPEATRGASGPIRSFWARTKRPGSQVLFDARARRTRITRRTMYATTKTTNAIAKYLE